MRAARLLVLMGVSRPTYHLFMLIDTILIYKRCNCVVALHIFTGVIKEVCLSVLSEHMSGKASRSGRRDTGSLDAEAGQSCRHRCLPSRQKQTSLHASASSTDAPSTNVPSSSTPATEDVFHILLYV